MKNTVKLIVLTLTIITSAIFTSCSSDDDGTLISNNKFVFEGQTIETPNGTIEPRDFNNTAIVVLKSAQLTNDIITNGGNATGSIINLDRLETNDDGELLEGTFNLDSDGSFIIVNADWSSVQDIDSKRYDMESAAIIISKSGNEYTVDYNIQLEDNKTAVGTFTGVLEIIE